ncbi:S-adenosyl-L-methionine-dependent methyltransferases superfamily protein [Wolffia australiana]
MSGGDSARSLMEDDRLNSPNTSTVTVDVLGHRLQFSQDPNSRHHGTTVWDASMVFVKFLEKNRRRGRFSQSRLKGKRVVELGAGCGLAGFGMALLGCDVIATDQAEVLPLLTRNVKRNMSRIMQANPGSVGSIRVAELFWGNEDHVKAIAPPFDYIIGTDVVYSESLLEPLLRTIFDLSGPRTTILMCLEIRSTSVYEKMIHMWNINFETATIPRSKMDVKYQHPSIKVHVMTSKHRPTAGKEHSDESMLPEDGDDNATDDVENKHDDWENRRHGSEAARLLKNVKITTIS